MRPLKFISTVLTAILVVSCAAKTPGSIDTTTPITISSSDLSKTELGITFSQPHANWLFDGTGTDSHAVLETLLKELQPKQIRLEAYWNWIQDENPNVLKTDLNMEWQLQLTKQYGVKTTIMCLGRKVPHWPEYHVPDWAKKLSEAELKTALLNYISKLVDTYTNDSRITNWQIENEPFFIFGEGTPFADQEDFLKQEIALVREHDKLHRSIIVTDTGDQSDWKKASSVTDILGITWYGISYNNGSYNQHSVGLPSDWRKKAEGIGKPVWLIELQEEPWGPASIKDMSIDESSKSMSADRMKAHLKFALDAGFDHINLWGAEWWLYQKRKGDDAVWSTAKTFFR